MAAEPQNQPQNLATAIAEVSEHVQVIVRDEIALAKAEIAQKVKFAVKAVVVAVVAGVFVLGALSALLQGLGWLAWWALPAGDVGHGRFWIGFVALALLLLVLGGIAGWIAARFFKRSTPPTPALAIEEAERLRATVQAHPIKPGGGR